MVVDTSAIFAIFLNEPERGVFAKAIELADRRIISAATVVECVSVFAGRFSASAAAVMALTLEELALEIIPLDDAQWRMAGGAIVRYGRGRHPARLNFGDSFSYALAKVTGEPLLFKGDDFALTDIIRAI